MKVFNGANAWISQTLQEPSRLAVDDLDAFAGLLHIPNHRRKFSTTAPMTSSPNSTARRIPSCSLASTNSAPTSPNLRATSSVTSASASRESACFATPPRDRAWWLRAAPPPPGCVVAAKEPVIAPLRLGAVSPTEEAACCSATPKTLLASRSGRCCSSQP